MSEQPDHAVLREWVYLEGDGGLSTAERAQLHRHLVSCSECRGERERATELSALLDGSRIATRAGFRSEVLASLPPAAWESRHPRAWAAALALLALLAGGTAAIVALGSGDPTGRLPLGAAAAALAELFRSALLAGAGLLSASWQGLGMAIWEALGGSKLNFALFAVLVLGVDLLFLRFLGRSWRAEPGGLPSSERSERSRERR